MTDDPQPPDLERTAGRFSSRTFVRLVLLLIGLIWASQTTGLVSSNDGSHLALSRALGLRGVTHIDDEQMLTLMVDRAKRGGHVYSDRPPGTAFAAALAIRLGAAVDGHLLEFSLQQMKADPPPDRIEDTVLVMPAGPAYLRTYGQRRQRVRGPSVNLLGLQGTAAMVGLHCIAVGLIGLAVVSALLRRVGVGQTGHAFAIVTLGVCTLWGPYSTALFSHATAGVGVLGLVYGLVRLRSAESDRAQWGWAAVAGLSGAWAIAADYALLLAAVPMTVLLCPPKHWVGVALGAAPIVAITLAYHDAAFGSPFSIGYDHHANFEFARDRSATFSGNPAVGLWRLWGTGVLLQSPTVLVGVYGLARSEHRRWLYGLLPWMLLLVFHQTPWGGATEDYRYLVPALPVLGVGLGLAWQRHVTSAGAYCRAVAIGLVLLATASLLLTWTHFWSWRS